MTTKLRLAHTFLELHPEDAARILEGVSAEHGAEALAGCGPVIAAGVIQKMLPGIAAGYLDELPSSESSSILTHVSIEVTAMIARHWAPDGQSEVLSGLQPRTADALRLMLSTPQGTIGSLMDPLAFTLPADITVAEARQRVEQAGDRVLYYLYIVDRQHKLVGVLNLREFIMAASDIQLSSIMNKVVLSLKASASIEEFAGTSECKRYLSFPVIDKNGTFMGVLSTRVLHKAVGEEQQGLKKRGTVDTAVALGELYWVTLSGLLSGAQIPASRSQSASKLSTESSDGR